MKKNTWNKELIKQKLETDDRWLIRGMLSIFEFQTYDEQNSEQTTRHNRVGFTPADAQYLSSCVKYYNRWGKLTDKQMVYVRKRMMKYAGQLTRIANGKQTLKVGV